MPIKMLSTALALLLAACALPGDLPPEDLDQSIRQALEDWQVAGLALAIVKDGRVVHLAGYGHRDVEEKTPVDGDTIFGIGSTSKAFGAAVIGVLVDEGKLDWDDRVVDRLPELRVADPYVTRELTVRDLLCHRSGVRNNNIIFFGKVSRDQIVYKARFLEQSSSLRSRFGYHNIMTLAAGQVAARVTGRSWDEVVREKIFEPLGMDRTSTTIQGLEEVGNVATPHTIKDGKLVAIPWLNVDNTGPAGSVNSSAADMARWLRAHLDGGRFEGKEIWSEDVQREMHSPQIIVPGQMARFGSYDHFGLYGLGWMMHDYRGKKVVHHSGATDGMGSFVGLVPEERLGVVVLHNTTQSPLLRLLGYRIIDAYLGAKRSDWTPLKPRRRPERPSSERQEVASGRPPSLPLERYAGVYENPIYEGVAVGVEEGGLVLTFDLYPPAILEHRDEDTFTMRFERDISSMWDLVFGRELDVTFDVDGAGLVSKLSIQRFGDFARVGG